MSILSFVGSRQLSHNAMQFLPLSPKYSDTIACLQASDAANLPIASSFSTACFLYGDSGMDSIMLRLSTMSEDEKSKSVFEGKPSLPALPIS